VDGLNGELINPVYRCWFKMEHGYLFAGLQHNYVVIQCQCSCDNIVYVSLRKWTNSHSGQTSQAVVWWRCCHSALKFQWSCSVTYSVCLIFCQYEVHRIQLIVLKGVQYFSVIFLCNTHYLCWASMQNLNQFDEQAWKISFRSVISTPMFAQFCYLYSLH
jgi:hypothetical protein